METAKTKKLINDVTTCVDDNLEGVLAMHSGLRRVKGHRVIVRSDVEEYAASGRVAVLTGGGSGHEPAFTGYVGHGMATGAVLGDIFASPGSREVLAGICALARDNPAGVFVLYNNYTGDRLNFGIAVEKARTRGIRVTMANNADDCALTTSDRTAGRRGIAGLIFMLKVAGALAEEGKSLEEVTDLTKRACKSCGSLGMCLSACSLPGMGPLFTVGPESMEIGLGLHGEAGVQTVKVMTAHDTVAAMINHMTSPTNNTHIAVKQGDEVAVLLNNLGATSDLEMNILVWETIRYLEGKGVKVTRCYMNRFVTSQEMAGFSITLMQLDDIFRRCLDAKTQAAAWVEPVMSGSSKERRPGLDLDLGDTSAKFTDTQEDCAHTSSDEAEFLRQVTLHICDVIMQSRDHLNQLDSGCGDGDCGSTLWLGAKAIQNSLETLTLDCPSAFLHQVAALAESAMGGSSGALYVLFFTAAAPLLVTDTSGVSWAAALRAGTDAIQRYGGAEPGDRTMLDPLTTALLTLQPALSTMSPSDAMKAAAKAGWDGAYATAGMRAQAGRASYVSASKCGAPDAGAWAVALCFGAVCDVISGEMDTLSTN